MDRSTLTREIPYMGETTIREYLDEVIPLLREEKAFIESEMKTIFFIGDIHGDFETTKAIIDEFFEGGLLVFLGDYIDREPMKWGSIYTITYLLILKSLYPKNIVLLKGNHECNYIIPCYPYEFERELREKFGSSGLHDKFVEVFSNLPVIFKGYNAIVAHGGILKDADLNTLKNLDKNDVDALSTLVWGDPVISPVYRGIGERFNEKDLDIFLRKTDSSVFIRGHDPHLLGISIYNDRCLTIFSSRRYMYMGNKGILVAEIDKKTKHVSDINLKDVSSGRWMPYKVRKL
ncbi:MAG: hypothetical protein DRN12_04445 [Thermoplasmata archaeon]|nr:MAG: hypothetical protein DRN12_04445 [Thermoplasmata archaeon]